MKYGQLVVNDSMNKTVYRCFEHLTKEDQAKFVKRFRNESNDGWQATHTYRELILGCYLCSKGYPVRYGVKLDTQTPDWAILDANQDIKAIIELASFHAPKEEEDRFWKNSITEATGPGWRTDNTNRLYSKIREKIAHYNVLSTNRNLAIIMAIFEQPPAEIQTNELEECLSEKDTGLFELYPNFSGVLLFREGYGDSYPNHYKFEYLPNHHALYKFLLA